MHEGHRQRLRQTYAEQGIEAFHEHQILELLLTYAIPRKDTNGLAHELLARYGSLEAVLQADISDLAKQDGIGEYAAVLLSLVGRIGLNFSRLRKRGERLNTPEAAGEFCAALLGAEKRECIAVISLDQARRVLHSDVLSSGVPAEALIYPRQVVECALRHGAHSIILTHNHPTGDVSPSREDYQTTKAILAALEPIGITLHDHIIVGGESAFSMLRNAMLAGGETPQPLAMAAEKEK